MAAYVFEGQKGHPRLQFRADYWTLTTSDCAPRQPAFDAAETQLRETAAFRVDGGTLVLKDVDDREIASFTRIVPEGFELRWWAITGYRRHGKIERLFRQDGRKPNILFFNGTLIGTPGAGEFNGTYTLKEGKLKTSANMLCSGGCMGNIVEVTGPQVNAILDALNKGELTPRADGTDRFSLINASGQVQLELATIKEDKL